jgi:hypothetical protein
MLASWLLVDLIGTMTPVKLMLIYEHDEDLDGDMRCRHPELYFSLSCTGDQLVGRTVHLESGAEIPCCQSAPSFPPILVFATKRSQLVWRFTVT